MEAVCGSFKELTGIETKPADIILESEGQALGFLILWLQAARKADADNNCRQILDQVGLCLVAGRDFQRLNGANEVLNVRVVSIGLIDRSPVHPREVFADAVADRASGSMRYQRRSRLRHRLDGRPGVGAAGG